MTKEWTYETVEHWDGIYYTVFDDRGIKLCDCRNEEDARLIASASKLLGACYDAYRALTPEQRATEEGKRIAGVIAGASERHAQLA